MSYGVAAALQAAIYQRLMADGALDALIGSAIYDAVPPGAPVGTYVSIRAGGCARCVDPDR